MKKELELDTLEERRTSLRLILIYKVVEGLVPALPPTSFVKNAKQRDKSKQKYTQTIKRCIKTIIGFYNVDFITNSTIVLPYRPIFQITRDARARVCHIVILSYIVYYR